MEIISSVSNLNLAAQIALNNKKKKVEPRKSVEEQKSEDMKVQESKNVPSQGVNITV